MAHVLGAAVGIVGGLVEIRAIVKSCVLAVKEKAAYPADDFFNVSFHQRPDEGTKEYAMTQATVTMKKVPVSESNGTAGCGA
jgi:hypothetical protein